MRRWIWDSDMPGVLVADDMGLGRTFTSASVAIICKMLTEKVVIGLPQSVVLENTHDKRQNLAQNNFPNDIWWRTEAVSIAVTEHSAPPPFSNTENSTAGGIQHINQLWNQSLLSQYPEWQRYSRV
jgi:hypothetical protein